MELRKLLLAGVAVAAFPAYSFAQTSAPSSDPAAPPSASAPADQSSTSAAAENDATANEPRFANYKGADIRDAEGNSIATIADVLIDSSGQAQHLVLAQGGVMGVGSTYRAFEIDTLPALAEGDVKLDLTEESLAALPEYTYPKNEQTGSAEGNAPAGSAAAPAGSTAPATSSAPAASTAPATAEAPAASASTEGRAATTTGSAASTDTGASSDMSSLWPVSTLVGAELEATQGEEASTQTVSDLRFSSDGKVEQVEINRGGVLGVGGETQTVPFTDLNISGTPEAPVLALTSNGAAAAPAAPKSETDRAPAADGGASTTAPTSSPAPAR